MKHIISNLTVVAILPTLLVRKVQQPLETGSHLDRQGIRQEKNYQHSIQNFPILKRVTR